MSEKNIEVDQNDNVIGIRPRSEFISGKYIHRASHLFLFNSKGEILLQKRPMTKRLYPGLYTSSVSGTVEKESYDECLIREAKEEIGIRVSAKRLFTHPVFLNFDKAFHAFFIAKSDAEIIPEKKEIESVLWVSIPVLKKMMQKRPEQFAKPIFEGFQIFYDKHYEISFRELGFK